MPARPVLFALLLLATLPPFIAQASGSVVGSFTMFARLERYHIELEVMTAEGARAVTLATLGPHLTPEARRILLPAAGYAVGADQIDLTVAGLADIATLLCALHPHAESARVRLVRDPFEPRRGSETQARKSCRAER
jgi:hypothetical protein